MRDNLTETEKHDHVYLVAGLHLLGHNLGEGVHGRIPHLVLATGRIRPPDQGQKKTEHLLVDNKVDVDPAHPLADDLQHRLDHAVIPVGVPSQEVLPRLGNLGHVPLAHQVLEVVVALALVSLPDQHEIGNFIVDRAQDAQVQDHPWQVVLLGEGEEVIDEAFPALLV